MSDQNNDNKKEFKINKLEKTSKTATTPLSSLIKMESKNLEEKIIIKKWYPYSIIYDPIQSGSIDSTDTIAHDKAIIRAINSSYKPNNKINTNPKHTIFIGNLNKNITENDIKNDFNKFGSIKNIKLIRDIITGISKKYCFIEFETENQCLNIINNMNKQIYKGYEIIVDFECGRNLYNWKPRRLGGGYGGNKNSGQLRFGSRNKPFIKPIELINDRDKRGRQYNRYN